MKKLIEALTIFAKYADVERPTHCEHDVLMIMQVTRDLCAKGEWFRPEARLMTFIEVVAGTALPPAKEDKRRVAGGQSRA